MSAPLTAPQARGWEILLEHGPMHPREFARWMWPDSPGWNKVTRKFGGHTGAMGGTMPMKGATLLWRMRDLGLCWKERNGSWRAHRTRVEPRPKLGHAE